MTSSGRLSVYSTKSLGPRMDPWGTPALTGYSCEDFQNHSKLLVSEKEVVRPNIWPEIP